MVNDSASAIVALNDGELDVVGGGLDAYGYWQGVGTAALGAGGVVRGGLILAGAATAPGWMAGALIIGGGAAIAYGVYQMSEAL